MPKFRKKPIVVEAEQWFPGKDIKGLYFLSQDSEGRKTGAQISTLEGEMGVSEGDWIITGVNGDKYPCKPDIFEKTYEPARGAPTDIGIRIEEDPPEKSNGIRFMTIVRLTNSASARTSPGTNPTLISCSGAFR